MPRAQGLDVCNMKKNIKTKQRLIPIKWTDVRFEGLEVSYIGLQQCFLNLPQPSGVRCDKQLRLKLPDRLTLQRFISQSRSETQIHSDNYFPPNQ